MAIRVVFEKDIETLFFMESFSNNYDYDLVIKCDNDLNYEHVIDRCSELFEDNLNFTNAALMSSSNIKNFISNNKMVYLNMEMEEASEFLDSNPSLLNKEIVLCMAYKIDEKTFEKINTCFKGKTGCLRFEIEELGLVITYDELAKSMAYIDKVAKHINELSLSPIEKVTYAYDIVRDKNKDNIKDGEENLSSKILGDDVVYLDYSDYFKILLDKIGVTNKIYNVIINDEYCKNNMAYIKDDKYNIDGVYLFEVYSDSKKDNSNKHFYSYNYFAKTKEEFDGLRKGTVNDELLNDYSTKNTNEFCASIGPTDMEMVDLDYMRLIQIMGLFINNKRIIPSYYFSAYSDEIDYDGIKIKINDLAKKMNDPISTDKFFEILYNVRKTQVMECGYDYPVGTYDFIKTARLSGKDIEDDHVENKEINNEQMSRQLKKD